MTDSSASLSPSVPASLRGRHLGAMLSFVFLVVGPTVLTGWYMWTQAADRYVSTVGFSVRTEEIGSAFELLGGVAEMSGSSSSDTDILYSYIQSQELVRQIDGDIDLRSLWSKVSDDVDPVFAYHRPGTIEDLTAYWNRMVKVYNDGATGLLELEVQAFDPEDARLIAQHIYDRSSAMINALSAIAREDATRYARDELEATVQRLKEARETITRFRNVTQIVDPAASIQSQLGILTALQGQLAQGLVDLDILRQTTNESDPRLTQAVRRTEVIRERIDQEREKFGIGSRSEAQTDEAAFADLIGEYERLTVDLEFAQQSYTAALAAYDTAQAEARRQSRYLAAHIRPTLAEASTRPRRFEITALTALFSFLAWGILVLAAYALRDRR